MRGTLEEILTCARGGEALTPKQSAELVPGGGIVGDRYREKTGTYSEMLEAKGDYEVTLIEREEVDAFNAVTGLGYAPGAFRRNLVTSGIRLNDLVGKEFTVGEVSLYGVRLCEPCAYLAGLVGKEVMEHMIHKAGLRAIVRNGGSIRPGCAIRETT
jgi:hypothetical protein